MNRHGHWAPVLTPLFAVVLLILLLVPPARAQEVTEDPDRVTDEAFDTPETERYGGEASRMRGRYQELERLISQKEEDLEYDAQRDRYREEQMRIDDEYEAVVGNFVNARLGAVRDHGSADQPLGQWELETSALRSLEAYAAGELGDYDETTEAVTAELEAHEAKVEELRAAQAAPQATPEEPSAGDGGEAAPAAPPDTGSDTGADTTGGPLEFVGNFIIGVISFVLAMVFMTPFVLGAMFALAWRREGSAGAAGRSLMRPARIALALGVAFLLWLVGDFFFLAFIALVGVFIWLWRREGRAAGVGGGSGGGPGRLRSWFPRGSGGGPGGGPGGAGEWDEERQGRNVAGAKGEAKVNQILASLTQDHHCYVFANLSEKGVGNIDHVLISPAGATIVETKANSGEAVLDERGNLTAGGRPFSRDPFEQAARQLDALSHRIGLATSGGDYRVCLASASSLRASPGAPNADRLLMLADLAGVLSGLAERLSEREVDRLAEQIMGVYGAAPIASPSSGPAPTGPTVGGRGPDRDEDPVSETASGESGKGSTRRAAEDMVRETARSFGKRHGVNVTYTDEAVDALLSLYEREKRAGHPSLQKVVDSRVGRKLSELLSAGKVGAGGAVELAVKNGKVAFRRVTEKVRPGGGSDSERSSGELPGHRGEGAGDDPEDGSGDGGRSCPECGSGVGTSARFCGDCGRKLEEDGG